MYVTYKIINYEINARSIAGAKILYVANGDGETLVHCLQGHS